MPPALREATLQLTALGNGALKTHREILRHRDDAIAPRKAVELGTRSPDGTFSHTLFYGEPVVAVAPSNYQDLPEIVTAAGRPNRAPTQLALGRLTLNGTPAFTQPLY